IVFDDDRQLPYRFEYPANLRSGREMNPFPDLRARTHQCVRIDHRSVVNKCTYVYKHRRHAGHAPPDVTSIANRRTARHDSHAVLAGESSQWIAVLIVKPELIIDRKVLDAAHSKAEQDPA